MGRPRVDDAEVNAVSPLHQPHRQRGGDGRLSDAALAHDHDQPRGRQGASSSTSRPKPGIAGVAGGRPPSGIGRAFRFTSTCRSASKSDHVEGAQRDPVLRQRSQGL